MKQLNHAINSNDYYWPPYSSTRNIPPFSNFNILNKVDIANKLLQKNIIIIIINKKGNLHPEQILVLHDWSTTSKCSV